MKLTRKQTDLLTLFAISSLVLIWNLWSGSLCSWDEGFYGGVSKEIIRTSSWIDLHWAGMEWSDKPPLYMWMSVIFSRIFGMNEFSVRLFSALCGIGTVLVTYLIAVRLYSRKAAFAAGLALLSTWHFVWSSKMGTLDVPLTFFITLTIFFFISGRDNKLCLFLSPLAFALAFLTKGMGAAIIPLILSVYLVSSRDFKYFKEPALWAGIAISLGIIVWWHWLAFSHYGETFVRDYFVKHLFVRTTKAIDGHTGDIFTYFGVIPNKGRPAAILGLILVPLLAWRILKNKEKEHLLPVIWSSSVFVLFSMVQTKLHWYIMPIYPALAIMAGWGISKLFSRHTRAVALAIAALSVLYLATEKDLFDLDYAPETKEFAREVVKIVPDKNDLIVFSVSDPGMQYYLCDKGKNVWKKDVLHSHMEKNGMYFVTEKGNNRDIVEMYSNGVVYENNDFVLIEGKK